MVAIGGSVPSSASQTPSIEVAKLAQDQQRIEGQASVSLIQESGQVQSGGGQGPSPDGTGRAVNVLA